MKLTNEVKIALTAIAAIILLVVGINFLKGINIFESSNSYYVKFKDIKQLAVTNDVYANGYPVGSVQEIIYDYGSNGDVLVRIELNKNMRIPRHTTAELEGALMGGVTMNLLLGGNPTDLLAVGDTLVGAPKLGAMDHAAALVPQVASLIPKIDSILQHFNRLAANPAIHQSLNNTAAISTNLARSTASLDKMMTTEVPQIMSHLNRTAANAEALSAQLNQANVGAMAQNLNAAVTDMRKVTTTLNGTMTDLRERISSTNNSLGALLNDRGLYNDLNATVRSADSLMTDLKANPKRYVHFSIFGRKAK